MQFVDIFQALERQSEVSESYSEFRTRAAREQEVLAVRCVELTQLKDSCAIAMTLIENNMFLLQREWDSLFNRAAALFSLTQDHRPETVQDLQKLVLDELASPVWPGP